MCATDDEMRKFERRVEEGYDLPDSRYELWLSIHHRESQVSVRGNMYLHCSL